MGGFNFGKIFGVSILSQVITFLNAITQPFEGTIFVFNNWQAIASKSAVAIGFVFVLAIAAAVLKTQREITFRAIVIGATTAVAFLCACATIYFVLASGYAPTQLWLFLVRDLLWMILYILMLVSVSVTVALVCLWLFGTTSENPRKQRRKKQV